MRRSAANQASISLFPFLAVLICTMGALVLLLLGLTQSMRHRMSRPAAPVAVASTAPAPSALATVAPPAPEPRAPAPESPAGYDRDALMAAHERERAELAARYAARVTSAREELAQLQSRLTDLQARRTKEESQVGDLASQGEFQTNRSQAARVALELAEEKLAELDRQRNELKKEVALTERRLAELQAQIRDEIAFRRPTLRRQFDALQHCLRRQIVDRHHEVDGATGGLERDVDRATACPRTIRGR